MAKTIKSAASHSLKTLAIENIPSNSTRVELYINRADGKIENIIVNRAELYEALGVIPKPFKFPTGYGSIVEVIASDNPNWLSYNAKTLVLFGDSLWVNKAGTHYSTKDLRDVTKMFNLKWELVSNGT